MQKLKSLASIMLAAILCTLSILSNVEIANAAGNVYFDIAAGNITINASTFTGYQYDRNGSIIPISGTHEAANQYIVYQSTPDLRTSRTDFSTSWIPTYTRIEANDMSWAEFIKNNSEFEAVVNTWAERAVNQGRAVTGNKISVTGNSTFNVKLVNVWINNSAGSLFWDSQNYTSTAKMNLSYEGDNRLTNIRYHTSTSDRQSDSGSANQLNLVGNDDATLTVGSPTYIPGTKGANYWNAVIGGTDGRSGVEGVHVISGNLWVGSSPEDDCTGIGGGGNGIGRIYIEGGTNTITVSTTGCALGGGIAYSAKGGDGQVYITGGETYAYNDHNKANVPAVAIGGATSSQSAGANVTIVEIGGDAYVYAKAYSGAAIGGGGSKNSLGGDATITIYGNAVVDALSYGDDTSPAGVGIGGGTGNMYGGSVTLNIKDNAVVKTGSIGGGNARDAEGYMGAAVVVIDGGTLSGQIVADSTQLQSGEQCYFSLLSGAIDNSNPLEGVTFIKENGGAVWINGESADGTPIAVIEGGHINGSKAVKGGAIYLTNGGSFKMIDGSIQNCDANFGGAIYIDGGNATIEGGNIARCKALGNTSAGGAIYLTNGNLVMSGGEISSCDVFDNEEDQNWSGYGGAVYVNGGDISVTNANIQNCKSKAGGAIYSKGGNISLGKNSFVQGNAATNGGGLYVLGGALTVNGGTLQGNRALTNGGAAYVYSNNSSPVLNFFAGKFANNSAARQGGAVCIVAVGANGALVTIGEENHGSHYNDMNICPKLIGNSASYGAGIHIQAENDKSILTLKCGEIKDNLLFNNVSNSVSQMGGVFVQEGGFLDTIPVINSGTYIGADNTENSYYKIIWHELKNGGQEIYSMVTGTTRLTLPDMTFTHANEYIAGWEYYLKDSSDQEVFSSTDREFEFSDVRIDGGSGHANDPYIMNFYAVWEEQGLSEATYIVQIPDVFRIGVANFNFDLGCTLENFNKRESLSVSVSSENNFKFINKQNGLMIPYTMSDDMTDYSNGEVFMRITNKDIDEFGQIKKNYKFNLVLEPQIEYKGLFQDNLTFDITFNDGSI